jgi:two-component system, cell cycle response regulator
MDHNIIPRILVIDDQKSIHEDYHKIFGLRQFRPAALCQAAADLFGPEGMPAIANDGNRFDIDYAFQGEEGLQRVQRALDEGRPFSLAFVDIRMPPGWDGVETISRIWEVDPDILIVVCSAYSDYTWEDLLARLGRTDRFLILKKPFESIEVRQLALALSEKWRLARIDLLTGLLNRRSCNEHLEREWKRSLRQGHPLSCVFLDIDFFKRINDDHGHQAGDAVLKAVAKAAVETSRAGDFVCRYGGEEFCVLLPGTAEEEATIWAERFRTTLAAKPLTVHGEAIRLSASFGVSQRSDDASGPPELLRRADQAMLVAKRSGRNRTVRFSSIAHPIALGLAEMPESATLFQGVFARDVMTSPVVCLRSHVTVGEAAQYFLDSRIGSAPVVDAAGRLAGILSEKDVMWTMLWTDSWSKPISEVMQANVVSYTEDTSAQAIFDFMCRVTIERVVVVRDGRPTGVISRGSLLRWFTNSVVSRQESEEVPDRNDCPANQARPRLTKAADALVRLAERLSHELNDEEKVDVGPLVAAGVSKMQELMNDLLAYSRHAHRVANPGAEARSRSENAAPLAAVADCGFGGWNPSAPVSH